MDTSGKTSEVNRRISKLLKSYSRTSGRSLSESKREWNSTPSDKRGEVRKAMEAGLWSSELRDWRKRHNLLQKQAAGVLDVPEDTYKHWETMRRTPGRHTVIVLRSTMRNYNGKA